MNILTKLRAVQTAPNLSQSYADAGLKCRAHEPKRKTVIFLIVGRGFITSRKLTAAACFRGLQNDRLTKNEVFLFFGASGLVLACIVTFDSFEKALGGQA